MRIESFPRRSLVLVALAVVTQLAGSPAFGRGAPVRLELSQTGVDDDARGKARLTLRTDADGRFDVIVKRLARNATFEILVDGVKVGSLVTSGGGGGRARFRSRPRGSDQILGFDPRGATVVVRDAAGHDVLSGAVPGTTDGTFGACCTPEDDGATECEVRSATECAERAGSFVAGTSCLPNPCPGGRPVGDDDDIVCCLPDDEGPECEDRTQAECAAQGGIVLGAGTCFPNPCEGTPRGDDDIQCCLPDDGRFECEDRTPAECAAQGGVDMGPGACNPDPCVGLGPAPDADIQCCVPHNGGFECEDRTPAECAERGGVDKGPGTCSPDPCAGL